jgi:proteasome assembly chaperone (PAC2) family protein
VASRDDHPGGDAGRAPGHLRWDTRPPLDRPVLITAFEGWNDAGDAASGAVRFLAERWGAEDFADIDPEEFFDFSSTRPTVRFDEAGTRHLDWPANTFSWARVAGDLDVVLLSGTEPQLRWRTFCEQVTGLADDLDARLVVTMGALLAEVPHSRPVSIYGAAYDPAVAEELALTPSHYEGPTGIVGVLHEALRREGFDSASLWAAVPSYVPEAPSPKAALALVARITHLLGTSVAADELSEAAAEYEARIDELVADDPESREYVAALEQTWDAEDLTNHATGTSLVREIESYLRDQR